MRRTRTTRWTAGAGHQLRWQVVNDILALRNARMFLWYEKGGHSLEPVDGAFEGLMDPTAVDISDDALCYLCGPLPFMQVVRSRLIEHAVAPHDIRYEAFGPDLWQADVA